MTKKVIIATMSLNGVIGVNGKIPWRIPSADLRFRDETRGGYVIMGRKTYDERLSRDGKSLYDTTNIIITNARGDASSVTGHNTHAVPLYADALTLVPEDTDAVFIAGGVTTYRRALLTADEMRITYVDALYRGECVHFPEWDFATWRSSKDEADYTFHGPDDTHRTRSVVLNRIYRTPKR